MKALTSILIAVIVSTSLTGCLVRSRRACPVGYHWEGGVCVSNHRHHRR